MRKTYNGTNIEPISIFGCKFPKGTITEIEIVDCPHTHKESEYYDSDRRITNERKIQCQQINVRTTSDTYYISAPNWGYDYSWSKEEIDRRRKEFNVLVSDILSKIKIK